MYVWWGGVSVGTTIGEVTFLCLAKIDHLVFVSGNEADYCFMD